MGYHCWLCGKNSNSKKQWQQHIQSEKHKEKVFTSDSDASGWAYRFPMGEFRLCDRCPLGKGWAGGRGWQGLAGCGVAGSDSAWPGGGMSRNSRSWREDHGGIGGRDRSSRCEILRKAGPGPLSWG